jgi:hypothetical protein
MAPRPGWETDYVVPGNKIVRLTLFWGTNYTSESYKDALKTAADMLKQHGVGLDIYPGSQRTPAHVIDTGDGLLLPDQYNDVRLKAAAIFDDQADPPYKQRLPVIFCEFKDAAHGVTTTGGGNWLKFCLIGGVINTDKVTLLHEMGHASGLPHLTTGGGVRNFMEEADGRTVMHKAQLQTFANGYFVK